MCSFPPCYPAKEKKKEEEKKLFNILIKHSRKGRRKKESQNIGWRGEDTTSGLKTKM